MATKKTTTDGFKLMKSDIKNGEIKSVYIFHGEEKYMLEHYLDQIKTKLVNPDMEQFNYTLFDGKDLKFELLLDAVESLPMFSDRKLVVVRDYDIFRSAESSLKDFEKLIEDLPETTCLIFVYDVLEYKPKTNTKLYKAIIRIGRVVEFPVQNDSELVSWLKRNFRALKKDIDPSDAMYMLHICGKHMYKLKLEVAKVAAYAKGDKILRSDIDAVCIPVLDAVIYNMTDAVVEQRFSDAIVIMRDLIQMKNDPTPILAALGKQLRRLYYTQKAINNGNPENFVRNELEIRYPFLITKTIGAAKKLSTKWCAEALKLCAEWDYKMKTSGGDREELLELLLLNLSNLRYLESGVSRQ
jgi:DNA polymerase-3 subunit delta